MSKVEWRKLGEITKRNKGIPITAGQMSELNTPSGDVRVFAAGQTIADIDEENLPKNCVHKLPSIIVKSRGYIDFEFYEKPFTHKNEMWSYSFNDKLEGKYIYYFLTTQTKSFRKKAKANSVKLPQLCVADTDNYLIPVPSLSVQKRIVDVLDTFTSSIENLKEQIALRRKQYEYYRDQLLDLEGKPGVEMIKLGIVCKIGDGIHGTPLYDENGDYYFVNGNNLSNGKIVIKPDTKRVNEEMFAKYGVELDKSTILMSINGTIGNIAYYNNERLVLGKSAAYFKVTNKNLLDNRYLYYLLQATKSIDYYDGMLTGSTIKNLGIKALRNYAVPVPSLQEQQRIVSILDTFETSIQNLEAQLALREKQYEYYRNKLLTFE